MAAPRRGKNTIERAAAWLALSLLLLLLLVLLATPAHSRQQHQGRTPTVSGQKGIVDRRLPDAWTDLMIRDAGFELRAWRKDVVVRPDRTTDLQLAPPAPKANSNVPGGPLG
ncbi:hypothetical protein PVAP13_2KG251600 [Panicum virgatum]|uniref:Uncharacterized protein n=1 Tax=Panicum virgatum TaxID=38727 RepID=A0A8T0W497_PANVG|nr:hypothetical protein PVAP13_2KG251600 [Panicum virgatum]